MYCRGGKGKGGKGKGGKEEEEEVEEEEEEEEEDNRLVRSLRVVEKKKVRENRCDCRWINVRNAVCSGDC